VQTREFDERLISAPAGIVPTARSDPPLPFVTVFPLAVVVGAGAGAGVDGLVVRGGVLVVVVPELRGRDGLVVGALATGPLVPGSTVAGTS
jgi:hypothetical protein